MHALQLFRPDDEHDSPPPFRSPNPTVKAVIDWYCEHNPKPSKSPVAEIERQRIWSLFISKHGRRPCADCKPFMLLEFIAAQLNVRANWTRRRWSTTIQGPFNYAAKIGIINRNPFLGVTYPDGKEGRDWTDAEYQALLRSTDAEFRRVLVAARFSGMRPGEIREIEWPDVRDSLQAVIIGGEKTKTKDTRRIPFNHVTLKLFIWLRRHSSGEQGHVFRNSRGKPWTMGAFVKRILRLRQTAGLSPEVKLHGGRHTFATRAILNGLDNIAVLAELLGHKQLSTTQKYVHLANKVDHLGAAMEAAIQKKRPK